MGKTPPEGTTRAVVPSPTHSGDAVTLEHIKADTAQRQLADAEKQREHEEEERIQKIGEATRQRDHEAREREERHAEAARQRDHEEKERLRRHEEAERQRAHEEKQRVRDQEEAQRRREHSLRTLVAWFGALGVFTVAGVLIATGYLREAVGLIVLVGTNAMTYVFSNKTSAIDTAEIKRLLSGLPSGKALSPPDDKKGGADE